MTVSMLLPAKAHNQAVEDFATDRKKHKGLFMGYPSTNHPSPQSWSQLQNQKGVPTRQRFKKYGVWGHGPHGGMQGISTNTRAYPCYNAICKCVFSSIMHQSTLTPRSYPHNSPNSLNLTVSYGNFSGGELWISEEGTPQPQCDPVAVGQWRVKKNEQGVRGHLYDSFEKPVYFPQSCYMQLRVGKANVSL